MVVRKQVRHGCHQIDDVEVMYKCGDGRNYVRVSAGRRGVAVLFLT